MKNNVIEPITGKGMETATQESDITMDEKVYTFRTLNSTDLFLMFKIIGKIGINEFAKSFDADSVKEMIGLTKGAEGSATKVGISVMLEVVNVITNNLPECETEIYQMLSNTSNLSVEQVKGLNFITFVEMVIDFVKKEEFKDFIKVVLKSFKPVN